LDSKSALLLLAKLKRFWDFFCNFSTTVEKFDGCVADSTPTSNRCLFNDVGLYRASIILISNNKQIKSQLTLFMFE